MKQLAALATALFLSHCASAPPPPEPTEKPDALNPQRDYQPVAGEASVDDIARFLSGRPVSRGETLSNWQRGSANYQGDALEFDYLWRTFAHQRLQRQSDYARGTLEAMLGSPSTVFYPFGGPDALHAVSMFPDARTYVLVGLENVGGLPDLSVGDPGDLVGRLLTVMKEPLQHGYFITKEMRRAPDATPILLASLGVSGARVDSVQAISAGGKPGVEIRFRPPGGGSKRLYYVAADLSNSGFGGGFESWLGQFSGATGYFKAASYLMHDGSFTRIRDWTLANCRAVLQDDSGIPYRHYDSQQWNVTLLGNYERPIPLFSEWRQADLAAAYDTLPGANFIPFGSGYHVNRQDANLQVYRRR